MAKTKPVIEAVEEVEYCGCEIQFSLPQWTSEARFDYSVPHFYPTGHAWEGTYDRTTNHNRLDDALYKETDYSELCLHPQGQWVKYLIPSDQNWFRAVCEKRDQLRKVLGKWRNWQPPMEEES